MACCAASAPVAFALASASALRMRWSLGLCGLHVAFNGTDSQSGYNALLAMVATLGGGNTFFSGSVHTGSHQDSVLAVRDGLADVAAIDCVSLAGLQRHLPQVTRGVRVLAQSEAYPSLPLITSTSTSASDLAALRAALSWSCLLYTSPSPRD